MNLGESRSLSRSRSAMLLCLYSAIRGPQVICSVLCYSLEPASWRRRTAHYDVVNSRVVLGLEFAPIVLLAEGSQELLQLWRCGLATVSPPRTSRPRRRRVHRRADGCDPRFFSFEPIPLEINGLNRPFLKTRQLPGWPSFQGAPASPSRRRRVHHLKPAMPNTVARLQSVGGRDRLPVRPQRSIASFAASVSYNPAGLQQAGSAAALPGRLPGQSRPEDGPASSARRLARGPSPRCKPRPWPRLNGAASPAIWPSAPMTFTPQAQSGQIRIEK
jgi:hypothetical protein